MQVRLLFCESRKAVRLPENQEMRLDLERNTESSPIKHAGRLNYCVTTWG